MRFKKMLMERAKKIAALAMATVMLCSVAAFAPVTEQTVLGADGPVGIENHWAESFLRNLYNRGLMRGDRTGNMNPNRNITRAEFVSIINRVFGYTNGGRTPFTDINGTEWYANDIATAYNQGYFSGSSRNTADAGGYLTREQAIAILGRNLKIEEVTGENMSFVDGRSIHNWSLGYVNAATQKGYISGYKDSTFRPTAYITRAEVAKVITDAVGELINTTGTRSLGNYNGNVTIAASNVTLTDTIINGDLYITEGIGLGHTQFENVHVLGQVIISGTGESYAGRSSITFTDCTVNEMIVSGSNNATKSIKADGNTVIENTKVYSNTYLEETASRSGGFREVTLNGPENTELHLAGVFDSVTVMGARNLLYVDKESVRTLIVDEEAVNSTVNLAVDTYVNRLLLDAGIIVTGTGEVGYLKINAAGAQVSMLPDEIEIRPGLTANVNGQEMDSKAAEQASDSPRILVDYPEIEDIGATDAVAKVETNKSGTLYWTISYYDSDRMSVDEIIKPGKYNTTIKKSGSQRVLPETEYSIRLSGLEKETEYVFSAVLVDDHEENSKRKTATFETIDTSKASFLQGYPTVKTVTNVAAEVEYVALKDSDMYWAVFEKGTPAPDSKALKSQKLFKEVASGVVEDCKKYEGDILNVTGLTELQSYDCYVLLSDGNNDSSVTRLQFTTTDATEPKFNVGFPKLTASEKTSAEISVSMDEDGLVYYAIYAGGTQFPVLETVDGEPPLITSIEAKQQVVKGKGADKTGKSTALKADATGTIKLSGLKPEEEYDVYFVAADKTGNLSEIKKITIEAKPDFLTGYPRIHTVSNDSVETAVNVTKDCKAYWAVLPSGSVSPNATHLKTQTVAGAAVLGVVENCKKNEETIFPIEGLKEYVEYELYILVTDGLVDSEIKEVKFTTADLSAPVFSVGYPMLDRVTDKSIDIKARTDEAGTLYYVLCRKGTIFPVPTEPGGDSPALDSEEAKNQVVLGNNGFKNGKVTLKQNTEAKFSLSGLTAETAYDLYIVAADRFNNISDVVYMDVKTADFTAPTAKMEFEETISGDVVPGSEIRIVFSEEVVDNATKKKLSEVDKDKLSQNITLYDLSALKKPKIDIDFTKVLVENIDGKTIVTFPAGSLTLNSANVYQFELNKIADTSNNRMDEKTLLPSFTMVAPMVEIMGTVAPANLHMTFELTPQVSETSADIFYDIIFTSSERIKFELYEKVNGSTVFTPITGANGAAVTIEKGGSLSLQNIKDKILNENNEYSYERFQNLNQRQYGIKVVAVNGETEDRGWNATITMGVRCVIGAYSGLSPVSGNPTDRLEEAVAEGNVTVVNYPKDFEQKIYFTDTVVPDFIGDYPLLTSPGSTTPNDMVGDTLVRPLVKTTKGATFYYLIYKKGTISNPTAEGVMNGTYRPQDGATGSFAVPNGNTEYEFRIEGLTPNVEYDMYCFLKGTPAATSQAEFRSFKTREIAPPVCVSANIRDRLENSAVISIEMDKEADIDWIVFNKQSMPSTITADIIRSRAESLTYKPIDFGTASARIAKGDTTAKAVISISNLERGAYYNFYAVAKGRAGGGDSAIISVVDITPADRTAPTAMVSTVVTNGSSTGKAYTGTVTITFSEPMYYIVNEGDALQPLTLAVFEQYLEAGGSVVQVNKPAQLAVASYKTKATASGVRALTSVTLKYSLVYHNSTINLPLLLSDVNTNIAGNLHLRFVDRELTGGLRADSEWVHEFIYPK